MRSTGFVVLMLLWKVVNSENIFVKAVTNDTSKLSESCKEAFKLYANNLNSTNEDIWALKMWDASSKMPDGLLSGNFGEMGNFQECVETKSKSDHIIGKYCLGHIKFGNYSKSFQEGYTGYCQLEMNWKKIVASADIRVGGNPTWAICTPSNCSDVDVLHILNALPLENIVFSSVTCQTVEDVNPRLTMKAVIGITIFIVLSIIILLSTSYDLYCTRNKKDPVNTVLIAFSLYTNGGKIFKLTDKQGELHCLNGMKCISIMWITLNHVVMTYTIFGSISNSNDVMMMHDIVGIIQALALPVDTFFLIGGTLITYVYFKRKHGDEQFNIFRYYFHRYMRLTPPLAGVILLNATLMRYIGSGPNWGYIQHSEYQCTKYWWSALLYIQNYYNENEMCVYESWYLNVDMQLYLLSPLLIHFLDTKTKTTITSIGCICLTSIATSYWILCDRSIIEDPNSKESQAYYLNKYYIKTHTRAVPWLMGIVLGFCLAGHKTTSEKKYKILPKIAWILCCLVLLICACIQPILERSRDIGIVGYLLLWIAVRPVWSLCVCWIIWACATNQGGIINTILTNPVLQFLNQFTYSIYILQLSIICPIIHSQKTDFQFTLFNLIYSFFGVYVLTFGLSVIWVLSFEQPVVVLEKKLFK